jgi:hypothetical protein
MKHALLLFLVVLTGCASVKQVTGPNGEIAYQVQCGKAAKGACTSKANDLCPHGYNQIDRNSPLYDDLTKVGNLGTLEIKADTTEYMLIQCK